MQVQHFDLPVFLVVAPGVMERIPQVLQDSPLTIRRCALLVGPKTGPIYGARVQSQLAGAYDVCWVVTVSENSLSAVASIAEKVISESIDTIVGVGGGRVLDVAKYTAYLCRTNFISIPTAVAHDGLASPIAVLTDGNGKTLSLGCRVPSGILVDLEVVRAAPLATRRAGVGDVLSNLTALKDWQLACDRGKDRLNHFAYMLSDFAVRSVLHYQHPDLSSLEFLSELIQAQVLSGLAMEIAGSSRPCSGSEHLFSHALDELKMSRLPHGIQVAVGSIISAYLHGLDVVPVMRFLHRFGLPVTPLRAGYTVSECIRALQHAPYTRPDRYTILSEVDLTASRIETILAEIETIAESKLTLHNEGDEAAG